MAKRALSWFAAVTVCLAALLPGQSGRDLKLEKSPAGELLTTGKRWALVVGISSYKNAPPHAQLKYAHRDAEEFARFLRSDSGGAVPATQMRVLTDGAATVSAIRAALHTWLPQVAGRNDVVYLFFAGHGVVAEGNEGYFVAHDSDPQNLHATGLAFREVNETLGTRVKAGLVILFADACHAGSIGWTADANTPSRAQEALESIGARDQAVLKLLASRPSERSYEDERWEGGHGVFTFALLSGLRGEAEQDRDGVIRVSELIDYVSRIIPSETQKQQNPRVAGNFEPRFELARVPSAGAAPPAPAAKLLGMDLAGPPGAMVYLDRAFRGTIRGAGDLRLESIPAGSHRLEVELPDGRSFEQSLTFTPERTRLDLNTLPGYALMRLESLIRLGQVMQPKGAWDYFRSQKFPPEHMVLATAVVAGALESIGQECVNDYVQSSTTGLKARMLSQSAEAFRRLQQLRPNDRNLEAKRAFCEGRAAIAAGRFEEAVSALQASLRIDRNFACAHNAMGVALGRLNRTDEARAAFERAFQLTPEWFLPPLQIAQQLIAAGQPKKALPLLEKAVRFNPRAPLAQWTLLRVLRILQKDQEFAATANELTSQFPNYAPTYLELAAFHESRGDFPKAVQAYDAYLTLAPNFEASASVKARVDKVRPVAARKAPSLLDPGEKQK